MQKRFFYFDSFSSGHLLQCDRFSLLSEMERGGINEFVVTQQVCEVERLAFVQHGNLRLKVTWSVSFILLATGIGSIYRVRVTGNY